MPSRLLRFLSIVFASLPIAFGLVRAITTGKDLRYMWLAFAALLSAAVVMALGHPYARQPSARVTLAAGAFVISTLFAIATALLLGTTFNLGMLIVASSFGLCCAASCLFHTFATAPMSERG
jgi:hypothetical protein